ncbi:MAG TPA: sensor histidine kinase [Candidatus Kapabacteria bacterium]|jgi:signal transduction histidine kinase|nr:sensor histidine kinase [Candidatus Kapabacteria bacterium]
MTPENRAKLADLIITRKDVLLHEWRKRVRPSLSEKKLETPILNDELPQFLDELARRIRDIDHPHSWTDEVNTETELSNMAVNHGKQRFQTGYDVVEVLKEYGILREVITDTAEADSILIAGKGGQVFSFMFNKAAAVATEAFQREKELEAQRRRKEYLAFVMHDLKTPLNAIMVAAHVIEESHDNPEAMAEMIQIILRSGERLNEFIQKTIEREKDGVSEGIEDLIPRNFELWPLVQSVIEEHKVLAEDSQTAILNLIQANLTIYADAVALKTVFRNLLSNAIKYAPGGEIVIGTAVRSDAVECWVRDSGTGIRPERLDKIFEKGEKDPSKKGSTGLGLAMVKKIIEAHGGNVSVESKVGEGSTFRFVLPMKVGNPSQGPSIQMKSLSPV